MTSTTLPTRAACVPAKSRWSCTPPNGFQSCGEVILKHLVIQVAPTLGGSEQLGVRLGCGVVRQVVERVLPKGQRHNDCASRVPGTFKSCRALTNRNSGLTGSYRAVPARVQSVAAPGR